VDTGTNNTMRFCVLIVSTPIITCRYAGTHSIHINDRCNTMYSYDIHTRVWHKLSDLPEGLYGHAMTVVDKRVIICGGYNGAVVSTCYSITDPLDDVNARYMKIVDMPGGKFNFHLFNIDNNHLVAIGGTESTDVYLYTFDTELWTQLQALDTSADKCGAAVY
jgi:N-acetylneuraminic acid mutarotase